MKSKQNLNTGPYIPLFINMIEKVGIDTALVYSVIRNYCNMSKGICYASLDSIAKQLQKERKYVMRHIAILVDLEYIKDVTLDLYPDIPSKINKNGHRIAMGIRHVYAITGKAESINTDEAKDISANDDIIDTKTDTSDDISQNGISESDTTTKMGHGYPEIIDMGMSTYTQKEQEKTQKRIGVDPNRDQRDTKKGYHNNRIKNITTKNIEDEIYQKEIVNNNLAVDHLQMAKTCFNAAKMAVLEQIQRNLYDTWVQPLFFILFDPMVQQLKIGAINQTTIKELERYGVDRLLEEAVKENWPSEISITFCVQDPPSENH